MRTKPRAFPQKSKSLMTIRKITIDDEEYPKNLRNIYDPPQALHLNGEILPEDDIAVALVGSRNASIYGLEACEKLAYELASSGITVVSGMARGIDTAAHRGALKARGRTIAVLGSGHNMVYPPENEKLYKEIAKSGVVITEFEEDTPPLKYNFPKRNRIISGISLGVVVVEAAQNSGALITANFALEQGREVFAVPGKINSTTSRGTHELIKDGAKLVQSAEDIVEELNISKRPVDDDKSTSKPDGIEIKLSEYERSIYELLSDEPCHIDEIVGRANIALSKTSQILLNLELKRLVRELPGKNYIRK